MIDLIDFVFDETRVYIYIEYRGFRSISIEAENIEKKKKMHTLY